MQPSSADNPSTPDSVIRRAQRAIPTTTRLLYGGYLILALAAAVLSWKVAPGALLQVALLLIALTVVASLLTTALSKPNFVAGRALLWAILGALTILLAAFVSASIFGWPEPARVLVARLLGQEMLAAGIQNNGAHVVTSNDTLLPPQAYASPRTAGDRFDRVAELSKRPTITLVGSSIQVRGPFLYFGVLRLENASLTFEGPELTIEAVRIEIEGNSTIRSAAAMTGPNDGPGHSGGNLKLVIYDRIFPRLSIDLRGGPGGRGTPGQAGVNGGNGAPGENSAQSLFDCRHGGGPGGAGLPGGRGSDGGLGYPGGDGGVLTLVMPESAQASRRVAFLGSGGIGGRGGEPGVGGMGGRGGPGGHGGGYCGGGQAGPNGPPGPSGQRGRDGEQGHEGKINVRDLAEESTP